MTNFKSVIVSGMCVFLCVCVHIRGSYGSVSSSSTVPHLSVSADHQVASQRAPGLCAYAQPRWGFLLWCSRCELRSSSSAWGLKHVSHRAISSTQRHKASSRERMMGRVSGRMEMDFTRPADERLCGFLAQITAAYSIDGLKCMFKHHHSWLLKDRKLFLWLNFIL